MNDSSVQQADQATDPFSKSPASFYSRQKQDSSQLMDRDYLPSFTSIVRGISTISIKRYEKISIPKEEEPPVILIAQPQYFPSNNFMQPLKKELKRDSSVHNTTLIKAVNISK